MTEQEQFEQMKAFDYSALISQKKDAPSYSRTFAKNAYYGFYLLAKYAGMLLSPSSLGQDKLIVAQEGGLSELALSYLVSDHKHYGKGTFSKRNPYTYSLVNLLWDFASLQQKSTVAENDYHNFVHAVNVLQHSIETSRTSNNLLRNLDVYLAKLWCRIFRIHVFLEIPEKFLPENYSFERDLNISAKRGIPKQELTVIDFRIRFQRFWKDNKIGKIMLLGEEWEMLCNRGELQGNPDKYELSVLEFLDCEEHYRIGLEWVSMLLHRCDQSVAFKKWEIRYLRRDGQIAKAQEICSDLLKQSPSDCELYCLQSNLFFLDGQYEEAQRSGHFAIRFGQDQPIAFVTLAYAYLYDGLHHESIKYFNQALELNSDTLDAYRGKGKALVMANKAYEAMECLILASRLYPKDSELFHDLADIYFMCGYLDESRKFCRKCLALDSECAGAYVLLGMMEIRKQRANQAEKWLNRALEIEPFNPIALNELAFVRHINGDDEECLRLLHEAIEIAPDFPDVLCSIGVVNYYQSAFEEALDYFDKTLAIDPYHVGALVGKGNIYLAQSDADESIIWYDKALELEPQYAEAIYGKVNAYRALGLEQEAGEWLDRASDFDLPESE